MSEVTGLVIALGSNLGDRLGQLQRGRALLEAKFGPCEASAIYETEPVGCPAGSQAFLNAILHFPAVTLAAEALLTATQAVEAELGRLAKAQRNAPRTLDVDILCCGSLQVDSEKLTIPHPRLHERRFVLQPMAELCGHCILPGHTQTVAALLAALQSSEPPLRRYRDAWACRETHCYAYPRPAVTVDLVLLGQSPAGVQILLIQRAKPPFAGHWALPGGFVDENEDLETAARRELQEETTLQVPELRQIGAYGAPGRDPRGHTVSIAYSATVSVADFIPQAADDAAAAAWWPAAALPPLAFDHARIVADALAALSRT